MTGHGRRRLRDVLAPVGALFAVAVLLAPIEPYPLLAIPFAILVAAFRPRDLIGLVVAIALLLLAFRPEAEGPSSGWLLERGWCLLTSGLFVAMTALRRPASLFDRGLGTVALSLGAIGLTALLQPGLGAALDGWMEIRIREVAGMAYEILTSDPRNATGVVADSMRAAIDTWAVFQLDVYPALLALATMAALAVSWYFAGRYGEDYEPPPPVRDFAFRDDLVWVLVAGLMLLVLPLGGAAFRLGENATLFMAMLYLARGVAILVWLAAAAAASAWTWVFLALGALLAYPFVFGAALILGLGDTWLHVRQRLAARAADGPGS